VCSMSYFPGVGYFHRGLLSLLHVFSSLLASRIPRGHISSVVPSGIGGQRNLEPTTDVVATCPRRSQAPGRCGRLGCRAIPMISSLCGMKATMNRYTDRNENSPVVEHAGWKNVHVGSENRWAPGAKTLPVGLVCIHQVRLEVDAYLQSML
jgi:hypothetical protein